MNQDFPSTKLFYESMREEYSHETEKAGILDQKAGILLALVGVLLPSLFTKLPENASCLETVFFILAILSCSVCVACLIVSVWAYKYDRLDANVLANPRLHMMEEDDSISVLIQALACKIKNNRDKNNLKANWYMGGVVALGITIGLYSIYLFV